MALPIYEMKINPEETSDVEVSFVALVDKPAIEINFLTFNSQQLYFTADEEKRIISGPAMVPDTPIYRKDKQGEYNVFFSAATIKEIALKFAKKGYAKNLNLFHDPGLPADGVTIFNSFVSDKSIGVLPMAGFESLPDGSWFISAKVENEEIWQKIKAGEVRGFSVEGNFSFVPNGTSDENRYLSEKGFMSDIKSLLTDIKKFLFDATPPAAAVAPPAAPVAPVATAAMKTKDGVEVVIDKMEVGGVVMVGDAPAPAGEHELEDGTKISVGEGGVITAIVPGAAAPVMDYAKEFASVNEKFTSYEQRFASYEQKFTAYEQKFTEQQALIEKASAMNLKLFAIVEKLAETPTANPAGESPKNFASDKAETREERLKGFSEALNKLKKAI